MSDKVNSVESLELTSDQWDIVLEVLHSDALDEQKDDEPVMTIIAQLKSQR